MVDLAAGRRIERFGDPVVALCAAFDEGLTEILGDSLRSLALYGAIAFEETEFLTDIDFLAVLDRPLTRHELIAVRSLHAALAEDHPPLGGELDGYYVLTDDAKRLDAPPDRLRRGLRDASWALHCAHLRAGRGILLRGLDPAGFVPEPTWARLDEALRGELDYVRNHLTEYPAYCILNLCRLIASYETHDVVRSKAGSAAWALERMPDWSDAVDRALRSYGGSETSEDRRMMHEDVRRFLAAAVERIEAAGPSGE